MNESVHFFTIVARNYLAYAYVLGDSIKQHHPDADFSIFVMDDTCNEYESEIIAKGFHFLSPKDVDFSYYQQFVFKYNITEASTGIKPFIIDHLFGSGATKVIYLDPDILCFRPLIEVTDALNTYAIVLTPHSTSPISQEYFPDDYLFLSAGVYNLGFIAVRNGNIGRRFVKWWCERLLDGCLDATEMNLFVDQKWIDLVPAYFDKVLIFKNQAYNIAYWNLHERTIRKIGDTFYVYPSEEAIAFIHFSGVMFDHTEQISKYGPRSPFSKQQEKKRYSLQDRTDLIEPLNDYRERIRAAGGTHYASIPYAFNTYSNGERISQLERSLYYAASRWQQLGIDPFKTGPSSFWSACRTAGLRRSHQSRNPQDVGELSQKYRLAFKLIQSFLQIVVRLLGPDMYAKFAKYMRQQLLLTNHTFILSDKRNSQGQDSSSPAAR